MATLNRTFARKISVYLFFILVVATIIWPGVGLPIIGIVFGVKGFRAYRRHHEAQAYERHLDYLMTLKEDQRVRGAGYRTRIHVKPNPQDEPRG